MPDMADAIVIKKLTKQYPIPRKTEFVNAVDNLDLTVGRGEIFGFLGANGAGKTTTIKILLGLIYPTQGDADVLGQPAGDLEIKRRIAYLPESPYFYEHMTAIEVVTFYAQLFGMKTEDAKKKAEELIDFVGLGGKGDRGKRIQDFSKGMRQRVGIAQTLINDPDLLFYDEPTSGLDAIARRDIRDLMLELKRQGKSMFLSSHQLEDVEAVCHRVSIIHKGKLQVLGTVEELLAGELVEVTLSGVTPGLGESIQQVAGDAQIEVNGTRTSVLMKNTPEAIGRLIDVARKAEANIVSIEPKRRTLEDLFVRVVGGKIDETGAVTAPVATNGTNGTGAASFDTPVPVAPLTTATPKASANKYKDLARK
ncbi:MAG: ABC transporter ATP-binding protein [Armatimonadetes bacterium]|nr:ABC transporter ATP-binding protein [Armatimonadota bacterium]